MARISRLCRLVPSLILLAGSGVHLAAVETVVLKNSRATFEATLSLDEFQAYGQRGAVAGAVPVAGRIGANRVQVAGRAQLELAARNMLGQGLARKVVPVLWFNGAVGAPEARIEVERQILIEPAAGVALDALMQDHGLVKAVPISTRPGWWLVEPADAALLAPIDTLKALIADPRIILAEPNLRLPLKSSLDDPMLQSNQPGPPPILGPYPWHLLPGAAPQATLDIGGLNGDDTGKVWQDYSAAGANIMIVDDGVELNHPDLTVRKDLSRGFTAGGPADGGPSVDLTSNHATFVGGLAAATGNNTIGTAGVAYGANIISRAILGNTDYGVGNADDAAVRDAWLLNIFSGSPAEQIWAINNSWGLRIRFDPPNSLIRQTTLDLSYGGRGSHGTPVIFAASNFGSNDTNARQSGTGFNSYNSRFVITVAALGSNGSKANYSETGPNITVSAPGGTVVDGMVSTDRTDSKTPGKSTPDTRYATDPTAARGYIAWSEINRPQTGAIPAFRASEFNGDGQITGDVATGPVTPPAVQGYGGLPYENGQYAPAQAGLQGTSFAAPLVTGMTAIMAKARPDITARDIRGILISRGQAYQPPAGPNNGIHAVWDDWVANGKGLEYNNWYGFGRIVAGPIIYGGNGTQNRKDLDNLGAGYPVDEPGTLRWPLLPRDLVTPITVPGSRYVDGTGALVATGGTIEVGKDVDIIDAPGPDGTNNVPDGPVSATVLSRKATYDFIVTASTVPDRFRIEAVELTVELEGTSPTLSNRSNYSFELISPDGRVCTLGRQSEYVIGGTTYYGMQNGQKYSWTFTEFFHYLHPAITDATEVGRTWHLAILDEQAGGTARLTSASLSLYGHQTYPVPALTNAKATGLPSGSLSAAVPVGLPSGGNRTVSLIMSGVSSSATGVGMTQAYWDPDGRGGPTLPVQLAGTPNSTGLSVTIPANLLPTASPGQGVIYVGNPALVDGRAGAIDRFETPNVAVITQTAGEGKRMKLCDPTEDTVIRYSRPPTVSAIGDIRLTAAGTFTVNGIVITDPDVAANLPTGTPETLTTGGQSLNNVFAPNSQLTLTSTGGNTYRLDGRVVGSSGFAVIQVTASDGVTTTVSAFRVIIPSSDDGTGCGGGMGLALLTIPLAAWFIRRRKRG